MACRQVAELRPATQTIYKIAVETHLRPRWGRRRLDAIDVNEVAAMVRELRAAGKSEWTIAGVLKAANRIFKFAKRRLGWYGTNPVGQLEDGERPKPSAAPKRRIYTREELEQTLAAAPEPWHTLFAFADVTGARLSDCLGLVWADVDLHDVAAAAVSFEFQVDRYGRRQPLKTDESRRTIELPRQLAAMLVQHRLASLRSTPGDFAFASRSGRPLGQRNVLRALRRAQERDCGRPRSADVPGAPRARRARPARSHQCPARCPPSTPPDTPPPATRSPPASPPRRCRGSSDTATASSRGRSTSTNSRQPSEPGAAGSAWKMNPPCPVLDRHSMITATAAPDAPPALVAATHAVRRVTVAVDPDASVHGWCVEASLILGWMLRQQGLPAEMRSCSGHGDWHWCIRSDEWILDPTSGQWGEEPLLVFREGSSDDWYGPGREGPADISEDAIVHRFAGRISPERATPLLAVAGLTHLEGAIAQAEDELREYELRLIRATEYPEDAEDATPPPSVGAA